MQHFYEARDPLIARRYASRVLTTGGVMAHSLHRDLDLESGTFLATAGFVVDAEGYWGITDAGPHNRVADPSRSLGWRNDFQKPVRSILGPLLQDDARVLVVEDLIGDSRRIEPRSTQRPLRSAQLPRGDTFEEYTFLPGPVSDEDALNRAIEAGLAHRSLGAVVDAPGVEIPADGDLIDEDNLCRLLKNVLGLFLRGPSYDGYLVWTSESVELRVGGTGIEPVTLAL